MLREKGLSAGDSYGILVICNAVSMVFLHDDSGGGMDCCGSLVIAFPLFKLLPLSVPAAGAADRASGRPGGSSRDE